jgi:hypothetical protein
MDDDSGDEHHAGLFDPSVLDSLNKLTEEIHEDLRADDDSAVYSSGSYNSDDEYDDAGYSDDDEDPESGENQLFSMMDDLVMELQMELKQSGEGELGVDVTTPPPPVLDRNAVRSGGHEEDAEKAIPKPFPSIENTENSGIVSPEPTNHGSQGLIPPVDCTNLQQVPNHSKSEKQLRLHQHVKSLLRRVADLTYASQEGATNSTGDGNATSSSEDNHESDLRAELESGDIQQQPTADVVRTPNEEVPNLCTNDNAVGRRQRGDSSADRLERLLGAISNYRSVRDSSNLSPSVHAGHGAAFDSDPSESTRSVSAQRIDVVNVSDETQETTSGDYQNPVTVGKVQTTRSVDEAAEDTYNAARAISIFTQRKRREYIVRKHSSNDGVLASHDFLSEETVPDVGGDMSPARLRRSKTARDTPTEVTAPATPQILQPSEDVSSTVQGLTTPLPRHRRQPSTNKKKKTKRRTNKHKKRRPQRDVMEGTAGLPHVVPEPAEPISQQSLRALLASLLALDDRLSKETTRAAR